VKHWLLVLALLGGAPGGAEEAGSAGPRAAAAGRSSRIEVQLPVSGWTAARDTQLVAQVPVTARDAAAELLWLGHRWALLPSAEGRVSAWLPVLPGANELGLELSRGPKEDALRASVRLNRAEATGADDLIIVAGWQPGRARLDLRVTDPSGEACDSSNRRTRLGGLRLRDDPEGPGPHVFVLPHAASGEYQVSLLCGRLAAGEAAPVQVLALLYAGTSREERFDLSGVVGRCDEVTDLGSVQVAGRLAGPR
jgi:uncharacterized protein YfaP (DUF2135 family)